MFTVPVVIDGFKKVNWKSQGILATTIGVAQINRIELKALNGTYKAGRKAT